MTPADRPDPSPGTTRAAAIAFAVAVVAAIPMWLVFGRNSWFFLDEWDFLSARSLTSLHDLFRPHNEHWSTLPIIAYRVFWQVFGIRTYWPYLMAIVALHVTAAVLLRVVMRRAGAHPWLADAGALLFLLLGSGYQNILWAFQIGFVGSLVFGLGFLILTDHDGPFDRRDAIGLGLGACALMCSGVGVTLVVVVALSVLIRRGWRLALVLSTPLGAAFAIWWLAVGRDGYENSIRPSARQLVDFMARAVANAMTKMGSLGIVAVLLAAVLLVGAALLLGDPAQRATRTWAAPFALAVGAVVFAAITGMGRAGAFGSEAAKPSRYVHLICAMLLPAIVVAGDALARRWRPALPIVAVLLLVGVPANVAAGASKNTLEERVLMGNEPLVEALPVVDVSEQVPGSVQPDRNLLLDVTNQWLRAGNRSGRISEPAHLRPRVAGVARTRLALEQVLDDSVPTRCAPLRGRTRITLRKGQHLRLRGGDATIRMVHAGKLGPAVVYVRLGRARLVARLPNVQFTVRPFGSKVLQRCR